MTTETKTPAHDYELSARARKQLEIKARNRRGELAEHITVSKDGPDAVIVLERRGGLLHVAVEELSPLPKTGSAPIFPAERY